MGGLFERQRARARLRGVDWVPYHDLRMRFRLSWRFDAHRARLEERIDESATRNAASSIDDRDEPVPKPHQQGADGRRISRVIEHSQRVLQPRSTSNPAASQ